MSARMKSWVVVAGVTALGICPTLLLAAEDSPDVLMREAAYQENTLGNLDAAIGLYERVSADEAAPKPLRAQARLRLGMCLAKRGQPDKANAAFQAVVDKHAEQPQLVAEAKRQLELFATANPASIMPPETIVYAELIRPGAQLEQVLAMFTEAGMPDPLSAIMQKAAVSTQASNGGNHLAMAPALLLNPDMVREFKKIEGIAVGLQDINVGGSGDDMPRFVAALYPGQSDALRGILGMLLSAVPGTAPAAHGNATIRSIPFGRPSSGKAIWLATADRAFLASSDETLLKEALDRLGGKATPSLADNVGFQRQAAARRRDSAVLIYAEMTHVMDLVRSATKRNGAPERLAVMETVGLDALEQVVSRLRLADHSLLAEVSAALKAGSACPIYDVLRTAKVDRDLLAYVPADVLGFATLGLDDGAKQFDAFLALIEQVMKAQNVEAGTHDIQEGLAEFKGKTGLDLRDDILTNLRSVAVAAFQPAVPDITQGEDVHLGQVQTKASIPLVIVKVKDPAKFESSVQLLADTVARKHGQDENATASAEQIAMGSAMLTKYTLPGVPVPICVARDGETFLLAAHQPLIKQALAASTGTAPSVLTGERTKASLDEVVGVANKLVMVRADLIMRTAVANAAMAGQNRSANTAMMAAIPPIDPVLLYTVEEPTDCSVRVLVQDLPKLLAAGLQFKMQTVHNRVAQASPGSHGRDATEDKPADPNVPRVVSTMPVAGATDVDPALQEIRVTFDRDMDPKSFAFIGRGSGYPARRGDGPHWLDARTCAMPVKLEPGRDYWVGINSDKFEGFKSTDGTAAAPYPIAFRTAGEAVATTQPATK